MRILVKILVNHIVTAGQRVSKSQLYYRANATNKWPIRWTAKKRLKSSADLLSEGQWKGVSERDRKKQLETVLIKTKQRYL